MSSNACFGAGVCGFRGRTSVLNQGWILNCITPTRSLKRDLIGVTLTKSHLVCCRGNSRFILKSRIQTKYAETVHFAKYSGRILFCVRAATSFQFNEFILRRRLFPSWPRKSSLILLQVRFKRRKSYKNTQVTRLRQQYPLVRRFPSPE